jgi:hypothetical protein
MVRQERALLDAASNMFWTKGFEATSTRELSEAEYKKIDNIAIASQGNSTKTSSVVGPFKTFLLPSLAGIADAIWDLDIPDAGAAKALTIKHAPGTSLFLIVQYRAPMRSDRQFGPSGGSHSKHQLFAVHVQTGIVTCHPSGPLGSIVICMKPEAAVRITGEPLQSFADTKVDLHSLFRSAEVSLLGEMLCEAQSRRLIPLTQVPLYVVSEAGRA